MRGQTNPSILKPGLQRRLRIGMTDAERKLWQYLRGKQLEGCKFRRQHPYYDYILDFVCIERKLVVELDGGQHAGSSTDELRDAFLKRGGFAVLRFWNHEVLKESDAVVEAIRRILVERATPSPPCPPLEGEGSAAAIRASVPRMES